MTWLKIALQILKWYLIDRPKLKRKQRRAEKTRKRIQRSRRDPAAELRRRGLLNTDKDAGNEDVSDDEEGRQDNAGDSN